MYYKQTYQEALAAPTAKGGLGWKYAGPASVQAAIVYTMAQIHGLDAEAIYDWANRHYVNLFEQRKQLDAPDMLRVAVLNDWTLDQTEHALRWAA